jgi:hypothetical protein
MTLKKCCDAFALVKDKMFSEYVDKQIYLSLYVPDTCLGHTTFESETYDSPKFYCPFCGKLIEVE